jgi:NitT/TauT family transport system permease protein
VNRATWRRDLAEPLPAALSAVLFGVCFAAWEASSRLGVVPSLFFPPPSEVALTLKNLAVSGELGRHVGATVTRVCVGFVLGAIPGYLLGMWMGWSRPVRRVLDPFVAALHPVPKISMLPIIMLFLGIGVASRTFVVALSVFFPLLINTMAGVRQIHPIYFEVARNYGAGRIAIFRKVVAPGSLPFVLAGTRLALNVGLSLTIAVELITAEDGIGTMIWLSWQTLRVEELYASVVIAAIIGIGIRLIVQALSARLVPWQPERHS